jgi:hypothetical protein
MSHFSSIFGQLLQVFPIERRKGRKARKEPRALRTGKNLGALDLLNCENGP